MYVTPLLTSLILGSIVAILISIIAVSNFTLSGPDIEKVVWRQYRPYVVYSFLRLIIWVTTISSWLAMLGIFSYINYARINGLESTLMGYLISGAASIAVISSAQFASHIVHIPGTIIMSSSYRPSRLYAFRDLLSVSLVRWIKLIVVFVLVAPPVTYIFIPDATHLFGVAFMILLYLPLLYAIWPTAWFIKKKSSRQQSNNAPNIVLIGSDTFRVDRIGATGYQRDTTPFMDVLAKKYGRLFINCYTPQARTAPSLLSLLTGIWPKTHGVRTNFSSSRNANISETSLAYLLSRNGYKTVALSDWSGSDLGKYPLDFDYVEAPPDQWNIKYLIRQGPKSMRLFLSLFCHNRFGRVWLPEVFYMAGTPLNKYLGSRARKWIKTFASEDAPFFLNVFMAATHPPFGSEYPYYEYFTRKDYTGESRFAMARLVDPMDIIRSQQEPKEAFDLDQINDLYDGCVRCFDDEVRKIVQYIDKCGLTNNTIVVVYSDHGMELFEHNTWGQGNSAEGEASPKIPVLIKAPSGISAGIDKRVIRSIDVAPTLTELCGMRMPDSVDGQSFINYLHDTVLDENRLAFFETGEWLATPPNQIPLHLNYPNIVELLRTDDDGSIVLKDKYTDIVNKARDTMVRQGKWKLVRYPLETGSMFKLFDLSSDPGCRIDISQQFPEQVELLKGYMNTWSDGAA